MGIDILTLAAARAGKGGGGSASKYKQPEWGVEEFLNTVVVETREVEFFYDDYDGLYYGEVNCETKNLLPGGTVKVVFDGNKYTFTVGRKNAQHNQVGNLSYFYPDETNTGEPFIVTFYNGGVGIATKETSDTTHTVSITADFGTFYAIPQEYMETLPDTAVIYVTADGNGNTDIWNEELKDIIDAGKAVYLKVPSPSSTSQTLILPCTMNSYAESAFGGITFVNALPRRMLYWFVNNKITLKEDEGV